MVQVKRYDQGRIDGPKMTPEGYLTADILATRSGIFLYRQPDGTIRKELRHPDDVFNPDSMASFTRKVHTNNHPPVPLTADNTKLYSCGFTGDTVERTPDDHLKLNTTITDSGLIKEIMDGTKVQISNGYFCDIEDVPGVWNGMEYDARQRNIVGNHVASVAVGRAGPTARMQLDAADAIQVDSDDDSKKNVGAETKNDVLLKTHKILNQTQGVQVMAKIKIDGLEYDVADSAFAQAVSAKIDALAKSDEKIAQLQKDNDALKAKSDAADEAIKAKDEKIAAQDAALEAAKLDDAKILERAKPLFELHAKAQKILGDSEKLDGLSALDIKKKVIAKISPDKKSDGESEAYINAYFDSKMEDVKETKGDASDVQDAFSQIEVRGDAAKIRADMMKADADLHKLSMEEYNKKFI